jgi:predicted hotdog family 3-hydroxylacyl-ACP dehydratase
VKLDRDALCRLIPHRGAMCLLDTVDSWDLENVVCTSNQHRSLTNPLRSNGQLASVHGVEFAAQAMAVHGGLLSPDSATPAVGLLVSLRDCVLHCERLDLFDTTLRIEAQRLMANDDVTSYQFSVLADRACALRGRATVLLQRSATA